MLHYWLLHVWLSPLKSRPMPVMSGKRQYYWKRRLGSINLCSTFQESWISTKSITPPLKRNYCLHCLHAGCLPTHWHSWVFCIVPITVLWVKLGFVVWQCFSLFSFLKFFDLQVPGLVNNFLVVTYATSSRSSSSDDNQAYFIQVPKFCQYTCWL